MQLAAPGYFKYVGVLRFFDTQADIGIQLAEQAVAQMAGGDIFAFLSGKRAVVYDKVHRDRRFRNFLERDCLRAFRRADRVSDMDIRNAGNRDNRADLSFFDIDLIQPVKFVQLADLDFFALVRVVVVDDDSVLVNAQAPVVYLADADAPDIFIVIDRTDQHLGICIRVASRCRDIVDNCFKQRGHVLVRVI